MILRITLLISPSCKFLTYKYSTGDRAVTIMLSPNATVHLQLWFRAEASSSDDSSTFPADQDFQSAVTSNQVNGMQPASAAGFCATGEWTVKTYNDYVLKTHRSVMTTMATISTYDDDSLLHPPAGNMMDVFIDDHISWDCTSPLECDKAEGGKAL